MQTRSRAWLGVTFTALAVLVLAEIGLSAGSRAASGPLSALEPVPASEREAEADRVASAGRAEDPAGVVSVAPSAAAVGASTAAPEDSRGRPAPAAAGRRNPRADTLPWAPAGLKAARMRCHERGDRRFCDGPRRVPRPHGEAAARAERLGLGTWRAAAKLLRSGLRPEWAQVVDELGIESPPELQWPVDAGAFGRGFGHDADRGAVHEGVDVGAEAGEPVRAVADGLVAYADNGVRGFGNLVLVLHGGEAVGAYAHLREAHVFAGQRVRRGEVLGRVGQTGLTRGAHLHFEWHVAGAAVDPASMFSR